MHGLPRRAHMAAAGLRGGSAMGQRAAINCSRSTKKLNSAIFRRACHSRRMHKSSNGPGGGGGHARADAWALHAGIMPLSAVLGTHSCA